MKTLIQLLRRAQAKGHDLTCKVKLRPRTKELHFMIIKSYSTIISEKLTPQTDLRLDESAGSQW